MKSTHNPGTGQMTHRHRHRIVYHADPAPLEASAAFRTRPATARRVGRAGLTSVQRPT